jgi:hypothetical protein
MENDVYSNYLAYIEGTSIDSIAKKARDVRASASVHAADSSVVSKEAYSKQLEEFVTLTNNLALEGAKYYKVDYKKIPVKSDGILNDVELANLNARALKGISEFKGSNGAAASVAQIETLIKNSSNRTIPGLSKEWTQKTVSETYQSYLDGLVPSAESIALGFGLPASAGRWKATKISLNQYFDLSNGELKEPDQSVATGPGGVTLKVKHYPVDELFVANPDEIDKTAKTIEKVASLINLPEGTDYTLVSTGVGSATGSKNTLGYANRASGAHTVVNRVRTKEAEDKKGIKPFVENESWMSTNVNAKGGTYFEHAAAHEIGHVVAYKVWPTDEQMNQEYAKLRKEQVSIYGKESAHEHFAESFAKYILTGKATPAFLDLLRSKNLLKSQQNEEKAKTVEFAKFDDSNMEKDTDFMTGNFFDDFINTNLSSKSKLPPAEVRTTLTKEQQRTRNIYVGDDKNTVEMNASLRGGGDGVFTEFLPEMDALIESSSVTKPFIAYRGLVLDQNTIEKLTPGYTFEDKGYSSTTPSAKLAQLYIDGRRGRLPKKFTEGAKDAIFQINLPTGGKAIYLGEGEIVLPRGRKFRVLAVEPNAAGTLMVTLDLVS